MPPADSTQPATDVPVRSRLNRAWVLVTLGLTAAVIALVMVDRTEPTAIPASPVPLAERDADMLVEGADISQFRDDGSLQYRLLAERIRHYEVDAVTSLSAPVMSLHHDRGPPWVARARLGSLQRTAPPLEEEVIYLREEVSLEQVRADGDRVRLTTAAIDLYPGRQYAETDQDVMIDSLIGRTTATGLEGDLQLGIIKFLSTGEAPVSTILQPEQFK